MSKAVQKLIGAVWKLDEEISAIAASLTPEQLTAVQSLVQAAHEVCQADRLARSMEEQS